MRLVPRAPANLKIEPHYHSEAWRITAVLSGTLYYANGDTFDENKLKALGPGSLIVEPKERTAFRDDQRRGSICSIPLPKVRPPQFSFENSKASGYKGADSFSERL